MRLQDPAERRRLGRLGFVLAFYNNPNVIIPEGPGTLFVEVHGHYEGAINEGIFRDCKIYLQEGRARCEIGGNPLDLFPGDVVGCRSADLGWIEPLFPLSPEEPPSLFT